LHQAVNRGSDIGGSIASSYLTNAQIQALAAQDIGNESAFKTGLMYKFASTGTTLGGIYEWMYRNVPADLAYQNERQRTGFWLTAVQELPGANQLAFGWARANAAVGDASGQHNFNPAIPLSQNTANMYTMSLIHQVDRNLSFYANYAATINNGNAHYDLGAGGHGITTDCHDSGISAGAVGAPANGGVSGANPQCWGGTNIQGISVGMRYRF